MAIHEIVKYNPINYLNGVYIAEEWSSRSDIGKIYNGRIFTTSDYMQTEREYIDAVKIIMREVHSKYLTIAYAEIDPDYIRKSIINSPYYESDKHLISLIPQIYVGRRFSITQIDAILQLCLREYAYIELQNLIHNLKISFGYDYYMKIDTILSKQKIKNLLKGLRLYVDPRTYDNRRRLSNLTVNSGNTSIMDNDYMFGAVSNVLSVTNNASLLQSGNAGGQMAHNYTYDGLYRLVPAAGTYMGADSKFASYSPACRCGANSGDLVARVVRL